MQWVTLLARLVLGLVFLIAGLQKLPSPALAVEAVQAYQILPDSLATLWGYGQPGLEIALGVLLILGLGTRLVAIVTGLLLLVFIGGLASVWARGIAIDCGCFSGGGPVASAQTHYPLDLLRDAGLLALAAIIAVWPPGQIADDEMLGLGPVARADTPGAGGGQPGGADSGEPAGAERRAEDGT